MAGKKQNYIKTGTAAGHKQRKRVEALLRQEKRDNRSNDAQLALIRKRRGESARERARL